MVASGGSTRSSGKEVALEVKRKNFLILLKTKGPTERRIHAEKIQRTKPEKSIANKVALLYLNLSLF